MEPERQVMKIPLQSETRTGTRPTNKEFSQMNPNKEPFFRRTRRTGLALLTAITLLVGLCQPAAQAQPLTDALFTVGTSATDDQGNDWAYLLFQLTASSDALLNRRLAVYTKPGDIGDPGNFVKTGLVALQDDPAVLKLLLNRAAAIGQAPGDLNFAIDELFGELVPAPELSIEEKLSAVILGSIADPRQFGNLMLLARMHPGVSLCLGLAHAQKIGPGKTTFEIRELALDGAEMGVVGRVVVEAGNPVVLPAPGAPVHVPDMSAKGHLNARLRWAAPDDLRRLALLQYGYNVYRVDLIFAEDLTWNIDPPEGDLLMQMAANLDEIQLVNRSPVLPSVIYDEVSVLDLGGDPDTAFIADDNNMFEENAVPFTDGQRFYYFVAARDILGRNGQVSPGTEVMISDRAPPNAPKRPDVYNEVGYVNNAETHHLRVSWRQVPSTPEQPIAGYYVYRWSNPGDVQKFGADPDWNLISGLIPHQQDVEKLSFVDDGTGSPTVPDDYDQTYWYTVRAVKDTVLGGNVSPNSAPAFGVLRNRFAPDAPDGQILIWCCDPVASPDRFEDVEDEAAKDPLRVIFDLIATRDSREIAWAEFAISDTRNPENFLGRLNYSHLRKDVRYRLDLSRRQALGLDVVTIYCRVGNNSGKASPWVQMAEGRLPDLGFIRRMHFKASLDCFQIPLDAEAIAYGCDGHFPGPQPLPGDNLPPLDGENPVNPIIVKFPLKPNAGEYRVYRRVDDSDLSLWRQGLADEAEANEIVLEDGALPPNAGEVSYFGQFLDDNGNASELKLLGTHVAVKQPAPVPMLSPPEVDGDDSDPRMKLRWFSAPHGVERFELIVTVNPGPIPESISPELSDNQSTPQNTIQMGYGYDSGGGGGGFNYGAYQTPAVDGGFGPGPDYELSIPVVKGTTYRVMIRSLAKNGGAHSDSNVYEFKWPTDAVDEATGPMVPWPARTPPQSVLGVHPNMEPVRVQEGSFNGMGVVIGEVPSTEISEGRLVGSDADIRDYLFPVEEQGGKLLPIMLYRYQVPNDAYPTPSGDIIQVSPLMEQIATAPAADGFTDVRDPFILIISRGTGQLDQPWPIVLLDTQPAVRTARYAYLIVRFHSNGEIASVHKAGEVTVP